MIDEEYDPLLEAAENGYTRDGSLDLLLEDTYKISDIAANCIAGNVCDIKNPQLGQLVYDIPTQKIYLYGGSDWKRIDY